MILYRCDACSKEDQGEPEVMLRGAIGTSGGILLPERFQQRHFCSQECFWEWVKKFMPNDGIKRAALAAPLE